MKNYRRFYFTTKDEMNSFINLYVRELKKFKMVDYNIKPESNCKFELIVSC